MNTLRCDIAPRHGSRKVNHWQARLLAGTALLLGSIPGQVSAQAADPSAPPVEASAQTGDRSVAGSTGAGVSNQTTRYADTSSVGPDISDIIVTAQRRDESLSRTPVSIAVVSGETLARANIVNEYDLRQATPGLQVRSGVGSSQVNYSLRGQSQDPFSGTRPGVLPYFNDIQISSSASSSTFYDLQSVQVLKGPQGTLFGRSATGGAILFNSAKPTNEFGGHASGLYGNYKQYKVEGAINIPLVDDQLLLRVAGFVRGRDGYQFNILTGTDNGRQKQFGFRPSLTAKLGPSITNELVVDYFHANDQNTTAVISGLLPFTGNGPPFVPATFLYAGTATPVATVTGQCTVQAFAGIGAPCPPAQPFVAAFYNAYFNDPIHPNGGLSQYLVDQNRRGPFRISVDGANIFRTRNTVVTNATTFELTDTLKIKNILGYVDIHSLAAYDADGTSYGLSSNGSLGLPTGGGISSTTHQFSDELQLLGTALAGKLDYVIGGYVSEERSTTFFNAALFDIVFGGLQQANYYRISNSTLAGYGQATYKIGESGFSLTAGGRYTSERVRKETLQGDTIRTALGPVAPTGFDYDQSRTFKNFSWTLGVQYQVDPSLLLYVANRRSYKSGGFNGIVAPFVGGANVGGDSFDDERLTDVEAGAKFNGRIGGMPARAAIAGFYDWVRNSQRTGFGISNGSPAAVTVNVPKGRTYGLELEAQISPVRVLTIGGNFNYTNAKFTDNSVFVIGQSVLYDQVPNTPEYSGLGFVDLSVPIGSSDYSILAHGDVYYQSSSVTSPRSINSNGTIIGSYSVANFRLGLESKSGISITANLKNAFDKLYYTGGVSNGETYQVNTLIPGDPRTYTIEVRFKF